MLEKLKQLQRMNDTQAETIAVLRVNLKQAEERISFQQRIINQQNELPAPTRAQQAQEAANQLFRDQ